MLSERDNLYPVLSTEKMLADLMTKGLPAAKFEDMAAKILIDTS